MVSVETRRTLRWAYMLARVREWERVSMVLTAAVSGCGLRGEWRARSLSLASHQFSVLVSSLPGIAMAKERKNKYSRSSASKKLRKT